MVSPSPISLGKGVPALLRNFHFHRRCRGEHWPRFAGGGRKCILRGRDPADDARLFEGAMARVGPTAPRQCVAGPTLGRSLQLKTLTSLPELPVKTRIVVRVHGRV
jgi:hypothetical protein